MLHTGPLNMQKQWTKEVQIITDHPSASLWALSGLHVDLKSIENVCEFCNVCHTFNLWLDRLSSESFDSVLRWPSRKLLLLTYAIRFSLFNSTLLPVLTCRSTSDAGCCPLSLYTAQSPSGFKIDVLRIRRFIFLQPLRFCFTSSSCADCQRQEVWSRPGTAFASVSLLHDPVRTDRVSPYESTQFGRVTAYLFSTVYRSLDLSI